MGVELYPYQKEAVRQLKNGSILCGGVGSGKSITALCYFFERVCDGHIDPDSYVPMKNPKDLYIITTARKRDTKEWELECAKFLLPVMDSNSIYDTKVVIDSWNNIKKYVDVSGTFFIFDEQRVVGYGAWTKSFLKITKKNKWILLSATPGDTWSDYMPVFIANEFYRNKTDFEQQHAVWNRYTKYRKIDRYVGQAKLIRLRQSILVNMDYRKETVRHRETILVEYDKYLYQRIFKDRWNVFDNQPIENVSQLFYLMRKVVNSDPSREEAVLDICKKKPRCIIFYNFDYERDILKAIQYEKGTKVAEWNGHKHEPLPKSKRWVYLVQYTAGAEGWNCVETDTIIFYSQNYSYKMMEQASGRIDRLNTPYTDLYYYSLRSSAPIDYGIFRALRQKKNFNENAWLKPVEKSTFVKNFTHLMREE